MKLFVKTVKKSQNLSKTGSVYEALKDSDSNMKMTFSNVAISIDLCTKVIKYQFPRLFTFFKFP